MPTATAPRQVGAIERATRTALRDDFRALAALFADFRARLLVEYRHGGMVQLRRTYRHWFDVHIAAPRQHLFHRAIEATALRRQAVLTTELRRRYGTGRWRVPADAARRAVAHVWRRPRGRGRWAYAQPHWPMDRRLEIRFFVVLDGWLRRQRARPISDLAAAAAAGEELEAKEEDAGPNLSPRIDPRHAKIAYPFGPGRTDLTDEELVERALDDVVVARGEYFAEVGLRDLTREIDTAVSRIVAQDVAAIIGWRWTLSPDHDEALCKSGYCLAMSEADVGHPHGGGVYFDALLPSDHVSGWCAWEPEWADEDDVSDPDWTPPEPPDDYEDRVRDLVESFGVELLESPS